MTHKYSKYAIAWNVALGLFMAVLDGTIVNVALTPMGNSLGANLTDIQWVITAVHNGPITKSGSQRLDNSGQQSRIVKEGD